MAAVLMQTPDGRKGLLAFTGTDVPRRRGTPRPGPCRSPRAPPPQAAVQEQAAALVLDVAGPDPLRGRRRLAAALAAGYTLARLDGGLAWVQTGTDRSSSGGTADDSPGPE